MQRDMTVCIYVCACVCAHVFVGGGGYLLVERHNVIKIGSHASVSLNVYMSPVTE